MKTLILPVSKCIVEVKDALTYGEYKAIEGVMLAGAKGDVVGGVMTPTFNGSVIADYNRKKIEVFVESIQTHAREAIVFDLDTMDIADGIYLEEQIGLIYEGLKKKQI